MKSDWLYYLNLTVILLSLVCCSYRYRKLDPAAKVFAVLVCVSVIGEFLAFFFAKKYHNNLPVYAIYNIIEFCFICLYFNTSIDVFAKNNTGYYIGGIGIIWGIANIIFLQGFNKVNSYFLLFEGLSTIGICLFAYFRLLFHHDQLRLYKYPHFWFTTILMIFWSIIFLNWSLYNYVSIRYKEASWIVNVSILFVNILNYLSISCVFILYPKMQQSDE